MSDPKADVVESKEKSSGGGDLATQSLETAPGKANESYSHTGAASTSVGDVRRDSAFFDGSRSSMRSDKSWRVPLSPMVPLSSLPAQHKLHDSWVLWYTNKSLKTDNYEEKIMPLGEFCSGEEFWALYSHLLRPNRIPVATDYHLFKKGIKPMWEDINNRGGGKWMLRLKKEHTNRLWEGMLLAIIGEQLSADHPDEICGGVVSVRYQEDILALWNRTGHDEKIKTSLGERMKLVLGLPENVIMEYKEHDKSMAFLQDTIRQQQDAANKQAALEQEQAAALC